MSNAGVKNKIKRKFGSLTRFAKLAGIDRYELQKDFARKVLSPKRAKELDRLVTRTKDKSLGNEFTTERLKALRAKIEAAGGPAKFCEEYPKFSYVSLIQILAGKRKLVSATVRELFEHLQIE